MAQVMEREMRAGKHVKTEWMSTKPLPDEKLLKQKWEAEIKNLEADRKAELALIETKVGDYEKLFKVADLDQRQCRQWIEADRERARNAFIEAEPRIIEPAFDIAALHEKRLDAAKEHERRMKEKATIFGTIWKASYGGHFMSFSGEAEEVPNNTFDVPQNRFDPRAQAFGEGFLDADFSRLNAYLAFTFSPPVAGLLDVYAGPWVHGFYQLVSQTGWYNLIFARATLATWVDLHQNGWHSGQTIYHWARSASGVQVINGRIDDHYDHHYTAIVDAGDTVTIRVGVQLYCYGRGSGGQARLDCQAGNSNYIFVPYVHWHLTF